MYFQFFCRRAMFRPCSTKRSRPFLRLAEQGRQHVDTVGRRVVRQFLIRKCGERSEQIDLANERVGSLASRHMPGPAHDERLACAAFERGALAAAERAGRFV